MHLLHTLLFAFITICTSTAIKKKFSIDFVTSQLPSCAVSYILVFLMIRLIVLKTFSFLCHL